jgi:hypothetical protein
MLLGMVSLFWLENPIWEVILQWAQGTRNLEVHHIKDFKTIVQYNIQTVEDATMCDEFWDINLSSPSIVLL